MYVPRSPTGILRLAAAGILAVGIALIGLEATFRSLLVEPVVPGTADDLLARIGEGWPRSIDEKPAPGAFRILAIGDSFGVYGGNENFNYILERRLRRRRPQVELVNLSLPALELHDQLLLWRRHGGRYEPDLVLHGLFVGNDLLMPAGELVEFGGIVLRRGDGIASWHPRQWLLKRWWDRRRIVRRDARARATESADARPRAPRSAPTIAPVTLATGHAGRGVRATTAQEGGTFSEQEFLRIERERLEVASAAPEWRDRRADALTMIDTIRAEVEGAGARYVLVIHPDQFQVEPGLRERISATYGVEIDGAYDLDLPQRQILEHCEATGTVCLDLLETFREQGANGGLYLERDTHYNHDGNRLAAQQVLTFLERTAELPSRDPEAAR